MNTPTVGRVVLFKTRLDSLKFNQIGQPIATHPAIVTRVHEGSLIDVTVFFNGSTPQHKGGVPLYAEPNQDHTQAYWCEWPPRA